MLKTILGVLAVTIVVVVIFLALDPNLTNNTATITSNGVSNISSVIEGSISVSIEGEVSKPGTYVIKEDALLEDLIEAAGGVNTYADDRAFNYNASLNKGTTYFIASKYDTNDVCSLKELEKVNINKDDAATLASNPLISSSIANSIVSYRIEHGEYQSLEDLLNVYGIGNATYRKIRNYIILHE